VPSEQRITEALSYIATSLTRALSEQKMHTIEKPISRGSGSYLMPFGKGGLAVEFKVLVGVKMAFLIEIVVD
jgi:hypothetical protein